jgi:outer membrane receptor for ferrienterochelin and colicins
LYAGWKTYWTGHQTRKSFYIIRTTLDKNVQYDSAGNAQMTPDNPYALTFDPGYVYGPNQGFKLLVAIYFKNNFTTNN